MFYFVLFCFLLYFIMRYVLWDSILYYQIVRFSPLSGAISFLMLCCLRCCSMGRDGVLFNNMLTHHITSHLISSYPRLYYSASCIWHCSTLSYCILLLSTCNIIHGNCHRVSHFTLCLESRSRVCNCFDDRCEVVRTKRNDLQSSHFFALLFLRCGPGVAIIVFKMLFIIIILWRVEERRWEGKKEKKRKQEKIRLFFCLLFLWLFFFIFLYIYHYLLL